MKKLMIVVAAGMLSFGVCADALDIKEALKGLGGNNTKEKIADAVNGMLSTSKLDVKQLEGEWRYSAPAVTFTTDNVLKKAGGAAASSVIVDKLKPFYKTAGIDQMTLTIEDDGSFAMKVRGVKLKGSIAALEKEGSEANFEFDFKAGSKNLGKMNAYVEKNVSGGLKITFDVSKLIALVEKFSKISNNSTITTLSKALSSYDGLCAGFELKK